MADQRTFNNYGGFNPNCRGTIFYSDAMDVADRQTGILASLRKTYMTSTMKDSFRYDPRRMMLAQGRHNNVFISDSAYNRQKATHGCGLAEMLAASKVAMDLGKFHDVEAGADCLPPAWTLTENRQAFSDRSIRPIPLDPFRPLFGSRSSGFASSCNSFDPVMHRVPDPSYNYRLQFPVNTIASTYTSAFQPPNSVLGLGKRF